MDSESFKIVIGISRHSGDLYEYCVCAQDSSGNDVHILELSSEQLSLALQGMSRIIMDFAATSHYFDDINKALGSSGISSRI